MEHQFLHLILALLFLQPKCVLTPMSNPCKLDFYSNNLRFNYTDMNTLELTQIQVALFVPHIHRELCIVITLATLSSFWQICGFNGQF
jgi:hypothetical protein